MRVFVPACAVLAVLAFAGAEAAHCTTWSTSATDIEQRIVVLHLGELAHPFDYAVIQLCYEEPCWIGAVFYYERNGIEGLQRNDSAQDDTCHGIIWPDGFVG